MDQGHPFSSNHTGEPDGVGEEAGGIAGLHRHANKLAAAGLQLRLQPPAARGHQGPAAGQRHLTRDIQRRPLDPAAFQARRDLQQGEAGRQGLVHGSRS